MVRIETHFPFFGCRQDEFSIVFHINNFNNDLLLFVATGLLYVDASRKANNASSCSHSCDSNCTSAVVARNGKLAIALTTVRSPPFVSYLLFISVDWISFDHHS